MASAGGDALNDTEREPAAGPQKYFDIHVPLGVRPGGIVSANGFPVRVPPDKAEGTSFRAEFLPLKVTVPSPPDGISPARLSVVTEAGLQGECPS